LAQGILAGESRQGVSIYVFLEASLLPMIVNNLYLIRGSFDPPEYNAPLIIDTDTVETL